jgi:hypothetical protein
VWFEAVLASCVEAEVTKEAKGAQQPGTLRLKAAVAVAPRDEFTDAAAAVEAFVAGGEAWRPVAGLNPAQASAYGAVAGSLGVGFTHRGALFELFKLEPGDARAAFQAPPSPAPGAVLRFEREHVQGSCGALGKGDTVTVDVVVDRRTLRRCARAVTLVARAEIALGDGRSLVFTAPRRLGADSGKKAAAAYREAAGPDGTLGFKEGWRTTKAGSLDALAAALAAEEIGI